MTRAEEIAIEAFFTGVHPNDLAAQDWMKGHPESDRYSEFKKEIWKHYYELSNGTLPSS